jgi:L-asparaginase II
VHEPLDPATAREMIRSGAAPTPLHHNCSGKHAGMLATAVHQASPATGYWRPDHPVQVRIARVLEELAGCRLSPDVCGIDGCSVPNWAMPLSGLAQAFARVAMREGMSAARRVACRRVAEACWAHPDLVAGPGRLDTLVMARLPGTVLMKAGAEGVYCGALPERGLGLRAQDRRRRKRAARRWWCSSSAASIPEVASLGPPVQLANWRGVEVGQMRPSTAFEAMLERLQRHPRAGGDPRNSPECKT